MANQTETLKHLEDWLRDAHAMEKQAEQMLQSQASRIDHYPTLRERIEQHIVETQDQAKKLEECMTLLGVSTSTMKDTGAQLMAFGQAVGGMMAGDEVMKGSLASYSFEHFEIASYKALIQAAERASKPEIAAICKGILQEEEAMAKWLAEHLDETTRKFLERAESDDLTAKK
ncbi:ferritin-like domain-containing protein [Halomonas sp. Bachu 37]|uniref:ferritin-like domain-containing protein n=1 Tax=Halomonas kashgarensis TaxID=3084920 RepID=UPI003216FF66